MMWNGVATLTCNENVSKSLVMNTEIYFEPFSSPLDVQRLSSQFAISQTWAHRDFKRQPDVHKKKGYMCHVITWASFLVTYPEP